MRGGRVFISYRRDDSRADSGRLYDRLAAQFPGRVFRDVGSIELGVHWEEAIASVLSQTDACIVVIGKNWISIKDEAGNRRLDNPRDMVREEVAAVLRRQIRVFPVLVGGARMPAEEELPADLQALCRWNAIELPEQHWEEAVQKLIKALGTAFGPSGKLPQKPHPSRVTWVWAAFGLLAIAVAGVLYFTSRGSNSDPTLNPGRISKAQFQFAGDWGAVVMTSGQRVDERLEAYPDQSFRFEAHDNTAGIGKWQYNSAADSLQMYDATNLTNNVRFSCTWKNVSIAPSGTCMDGRDNAWTVSLSRLPGRAFERSYNIPRVNLSGLSIAEKAAFSESAAHQKCGCGMTLLVCLRTHPACRYSAGISQTTLAEFLGKVRS